MEPWNQKSQIAQEHGLLPADARQQIVDSSLCWPKGASDGRLKVSGRQIKKQTNKQKQKLRKPFLGKISHFLLPIAQARSQQTGIAELLCTSVQFQ